MSTKANLNIDQGASFTATIQLTDEGGTPLDLSGFTANSQMRRWYTSNTAYPFVATLSEGQIILTMNAASTAALSYERYIYDVTLTDSSNTVTRVVEGIVTVDPAVTR